VGGLEGGLLEEVNLDVEAGFVLLVGFVVGSV